MMYDYEIGIPCADLLAIIYYVKRKYFKDVDVEYDKTFKDFVFDLVLAKGIPEDQY